jgi:hypothetical protein
VDRDRRSDTEVAHLKDRGIVVLDVAEIENVFCLDEVLQIVCQRMERDPHEDLPAVFAFVRDQLEQELDTQIAERVRSDVEYAMATSGIQGKTREDINRSFTTAVSGIDAGALYDSAQAVLQTALASGNHGEVLKVYNGKRALPRRVAPSLGLAEDELPDYVIRLAKGDLMDDLREAIRPYLGGLDELLAAHTAEPPTKAAADTDQGAEPHQGGGE